MVRLQSLHFSSLFFTDLVVDLFVMRCELNILHMLQGFSILNEIS